jgi:hypothetical protein
MRRTIGIGRQWVRAVMAAADGATTKLPRGAAIERAKDQRREVVYFAHAFSKPRCKQTIAAQRTSHLISSAGDNCGMGRCSTSM